MALCFLELKKYELAIEYYKYSIVLDPNSAKAWKELGDAYLFSASYALAIESYKKTLSINNSQSMAWYNLGASYNYLNDYKNAKFSYENAFLLDPDSIYFDKNIKLKYNIK